MTVREWILKNYKASRLEALDSEIPGYSEKVIFSHEEQFAKHGETLISRHESQTGKAEWYRG